MFRDDTEHVVCNRRKKFTARKRVDLFSPQMDSLAKPSELTEGSSEDVSIESTNVLCDDVTATCFVESGNISLSKWTLPKPLAFQEVRFMEIADFMRRPYLLETPFEWTSSNTFGTTINNSGAGYSPATLLLATSAWLNKIEGFNLFRATFVLRVEINAYPFQAGRLLIHYLPNYANFNSTDLGYAKRQNFSMVTKVQHPHIELDCRQTTAELRVPWIAPSPYWDKKNQLYDWGTIFVDVLSVLAFGANSNTKPVEVSCYGYWENIELAAPCNAQMNTKSELNAKPISEILKTTSMVASRFSDIPLLSKFTQPLSWVTNHLSGIASIFGWSKPLLNVETVVTTKQKNRYFATSDGPSTAYPCGMISDNRLQVYDKSTIRKEDEMSFNFLKQVPLLVLNSSNSYVPYQWSTSNATTTVLFDQQISPLALGHQNVFSYNAGAHTYTCNYFAPYQYLASKFMYWRGSFNVTLKFVKTIYHTGRIQITWTPYHLVTNSTTLFTGFFSLRTIVDIREQDEITLNLPYMVNEPWLYTSSAQDVGGKVGYNSGDLRILVLNELRCPETCASTIDMLVYLEPGHDFELAVPSSDPNYYPGFFSPQMDSSSTVLVQRGVGGARVVPDSLEVDQYTVGERFTGVKQLINRMANLLPVTTASPWNTHRNFVLYPQFLSCAGLVSSAGGVLSTPPFISDPLSFCAGMYAYSRGSVDVAFSNAITGPIMGGVIPGLIKVASGGSSAVPYVVDYTNYGTPNTASGYLIGYSQITTPAVVPTDNTDGVNYFHCPYYNNYPITLNTFFDGTQAGLWTESSFPETALSLSGSSNFGTTSCLFRNAGDDFQLSFFIGCPPLLSAKT